jgi:hypothetical protein
MLKLQDKVKKSKSVKVIGKQKKTVKTVKVVKVKKVIEPILLKAQAFLESKKFKVSAIRSRAVYAVAFFMKAKAVIGKEYKAVEVLKGNTSSLPIIGSDTRKAVELYTKHKVKKGELKAGNPNLCLSFRLVK